MACPRPVKTRQAAKQQRTAKVTASRCPSLCSGLAGSAFFPAKNRRGRGGGGPWGEASPRQGQSADCGRCKVGSDGFRTGLDWTKREILLAGRLMGLDLH